MTKRIEKTAPWGSYGRVSRTNGRDGSSYISPTEQLGTNRETAERLGLVLRWEDVEQDVSGKTMERTILDQHIARIRSGEQAGIIVPRLNRYARNLVGGVQVAEEILAAGGSIIFGDQPDLDLRTRNGRLIFNILLSVAQAELEGLSESWSRAVAHANARGVSHVVPFGYRRAGDDNPAEPKQLWPDEIEAAAVELMCERRAAGVSWPEIAAEMDATPVRPRRAAHWNHKAVRQIVQSRIYLGVAEVGGVHGLSNPDAHQPLVSDDLWHRANAVRGVRRADAGKKDGNLLSGLVRCSGCGYVMRNEPQAYTNAAGERVVKRYYRCAKKHGRGTCPAPVNIAAPDLERYVWERFVATVFAEDAEGGDLEREVSVSEAAAANEARRDRLARRLRNFQTILADYDDPSSTAARETREQVASSARSSATCSRVSRAELAEADREVEAIHRRANGLGDLPEELTRETAADAPVERRNQWLRLLFAFVVVRGDRSPKVGVEARVLGLVRAQEVDPAADPIDVALDVARGEVATAA